MGSSIFIGNILNSNSKGSQNYRYGLMCNQVNRVSKTGRDIIILTDDNINTLEENSATNLYKNADLKLLRDNILIDNRLVTHNDQPTFLGLVLVLV